MQRSQPAEGTRPAEKRRRSLEVSTEHPTEHRTVRENKVSRGRENAANPREVERPVQKVEERQRGGEEVRTSGINEVKGEGMTERDKRTYKPREPASRR